FGAGKHNRIETGQIDTEDVAGVITHDRERGHDGSLTLDRTQRLEANLSRQGGDGCGPCVTVETAAYYRMSR
ncbi:MAG: hypothetical protein IT298_02065, partial [Chloroflexi bacterium]|nr:hypothetical protein [Chloroflexota bacterium]